jgi:hypothetical protein
MGSLAKVVSNAICVDVLGMEQQEINKFKKVPKKYKCTTSYYNIFPE